MRYSSRGKEIVIRRTKSLLLPAQGTICENYKREISQLDRQKDAIIALQRRDLATAADYKGIFTGLESPKLVPLSLPINFLDEKLDDDQKRSIQKIFDAQDIAVIQGPPGTGKSNLIIEVVRQVLRRNRADELAAARILIVSQAHAAVDKLLQDLDQYLDGIMTIRIGRDENLSELSKSKYSLEVQRKKWIEEIVSKSSKQLHDLLSAQNLVYSEFREFIDYYRVVLLENAQPNEKQIAQEKIDEYLIEHNLQLENPNFVRTIIIFEWISSLKERQDIEEYFIKTATIIAGTCSGFSSNRYLNDMEFDYLIVDEAAKATLPEILIPLIRARKVILIGDQMQLPPVLDSDAFSEDPQGKIILEQLYEAGFGHIYCTTSSLV